MKTKDKPLLGGLVFTIYFYAYLDTSVEVPKVSLC